MPLAGQRVRALDFTAAVKAENSTVLTNISTTLAVGVPEVGVAFIAPTSGKVLVTVGASVIDDGGSNSAILDWEIRLNNNAGAVIVATGSNLRRLTLRGGAQAQEASRTVLVTGLTPGSTYFARTLHAAYAGATVDIYSRSITITPSPA